MAVTPAFHTTRDDRFVNRLAECRAVAERIGLPLLPWQADAIAVLTEYDPETLRPHRRRSLIMTPRQSGKSSLLAVLIIEAFTRTAGLFGVFMAQNRVGATNRLRVLADLLHRSGLDPGARVTLGSGNERLMFSNGSVLQVQPPTATSAHGESLSGGAWLDETFALKSHVLQGVSPALAAMVNEDSRLWFASTAGTEADSELLNALRLQGRSDPEGALAIVDYAAPDDVHPFDADRWAEFHPGLGLTVQADYLADEIASGMRLQEFARAYLNRTTVQLEEAIPADAWSETTRALLPVHGLTLAVDVHSGLSIAAAFQTDAGWHADLVRHWQQPPPSSVVEAALSELIDAYAPDGLAVDSSGAIASALPTLQRIADSAVIPLRKFNQMERARADRFLYDAVTHGRLSHDASEPLELAVQGVATVPAGELWRFSRSKSVGDVSPILALSVALYGAYESEELDPKPALHVFT